VEAAEYTKSRPNRPVPKWDAVVAVTSEVREDEVLLVLPRRRTYHP